MSSTGIKVAQVGFDATKAANKNLLYTTDVPSLKLYDFGTVTFKFPDALGVSITHTVSILHSLGYIPIYRVFFAPQPGVNSWYLDAHTFDASLDPVNTATCLTQISSTAIQLIFAGYGQSTYKARYYIFQDRIT